MSQFATIQADFNLDPVYEQLNKGSEEAMREVYQKCYDACPVDTGYMRSTIGYDSNSVYVEADYAPFTEYRTGWFTTAVQSSIADVRTIFNI